MIKYYKWKFALFILNWKFVVHPYFIAFFLLAILIVGCKKEDIPEPEPEPCSELVDGVYIYPTEKSDTSLSSEEIKEYWNIPEDILKCISTEGLLKSCYNTMYTIFVSASNGYQAGYYLVTRWNRGFDELESRTDAPQILIDYCTSIELNKTST